MSSASPDGSRMSKKWDWQSSSTLAAANRLGVCHRRKADAGHLGTKPSSQSVSQRALEAAMAGDNDAPAAPECRVVRAGQCQIFHGALPDAQSSSSKVLSRNVSIGVPKTAMLERHHLPHRGEPNDRCPFPTGVIAFDEIEARGDRTKKPPLIRPPSPLGFSVNAGHCIALTLKSPITARRPYRCDGRQLAMAQVEFDGRADIRNWPRHRRR